MSPARARTSAPPAAHTHTGIEASSSASEKITALDGLGVGAGDGVTTDSGSGSGSGVMTTVTTGSGSGVVTPSPIPLAYGTVSTGMVMRLKNAHEAGPDPTSPVSATPGCLNESTREGYPELQVPALGRDVRANTFVRRSGCTRRRDRWRRS